MSHLLEPPPYRSPDWLAWRCQGLGASDFPVLFGVSRFKGEYELALEKRGQAEPFAGNAATDWGARIEGVALDAVDEMLGIKVARGETWGDDRWPRLWASLDGRDGPPSGGGIGYEIKATSRWRGEPPDDVVIQCQVQAGLAGLERVDVVRVSPYGQPEITSVERDEGLIEKLLVTGVRWVARYIDGDEVPPLDGSRAARDYLDGLRGEATTTASPEQATLARQLRDIRSKAKDFERMDRQLVDDLKASMAGYGTLEGDGFRITWRARKGITRTDWRLVAQAYRKKLIDWNRTLEPAYDGADLDVLESLHTEVEKPGTQFRPTWTDEEEDTDDD